MYGGTPPVAGGVIGGSLAATGANPAFPILIATLSLVIGALLFARDKYLRRQYGTTD